MANRSIFDTGLRSDGGLTYMHYDNRTYGPLLWQFGDGLSYSTWRVQPAAGSHAAMTTTTAALAAAPVEFAVDVANAAGPAGCYSALGFIKSSHPDAPRNKELFDYARANVPAGGRATLTLRLDADRALVLQGDHGYSRKSDRGQASYYYSQPFYTASGRIVIDDKPVDVTGTAWMDREWSSQPLAADQTGWDWFSLHLPGDEKLMLYRLRQQDGRENLFGNWITPDGRSTEIAAAGNSLTPIATTEIAGRKLPTSWRVALPARGLAIGGGGRVDTQPCLRGELLAASRATRLATAPVGCLQH